MKRYSSVFPAAEAFILDRPLREGNDPGHQMDRNHRGLEDRRSTGDHHDGENKHWLGEIA